MNKIPKCLNQIVYFNTFIKNQRHFSPSDGSFLNLKNFVHEKAATNNYWANSKNVHIHQYNTSVTAEEEEKETTNLKNKQNHSSICSL